MPLFDAVFFLLLLVSSFLIMVGAKNFLPALLKLALPLLVLVALLPCLLAWGRSAFELGASEVSEIPPATMGVVVLGHLALAVALIRRYLRQHLRPSAEAVELDRTRGRERTRLPPRGEG
jgi:hypothetical protein